ncbi:sulfur carrier protein ThiS [Helicobacter sp. MIT 21-1697]|uniref:sulfur carrier protein ThiS n=1 Tax=Helicobacter sp. MIT 21-1697 TaxID=2993733 RepID=UPI00224B1BBC|nr:sulfur carrier protein ThiS [Helicobacter sp. MIT 21-1697]MCX2716171.1 sulfur carrier protein ThiS [Helicobacter sp. MIT 21-1697]
MSGHILLNGKDYELNEQVSILSLLKELGILHKAMAIAVNTQVVKKCLWESYILQNGDEVEILDFVGGG